MAVTLHNPLAFPTDANAGKKKPRAHRDSCCQPIFVIPNNKE